MKTQVNKTGITNIYNLIILDESGSMTSIYEQASGGANETIQNTMPIDKVRDLTKDDYRPC